ncbi:sensor histidine kinase [Brevibacillus sp. GCM10020057]|uniref:sensor histidine kinase n=1 Tax=Brevibacillus sp. GCM10020057 TaxID=3317327 RepID=UPI00362EEE86
MSIKTRLLLSYIAMIIVPVILFGLTASALAGLFFGDAARGSGEYGGPPFWNKFNEQRELVSGVKFMALHDPDRLLAPNVLASVDSKLASLNAALVLAKGGTVVYASPSVSQADQTRLLGGTFAEKERPRWPGGRGYSAESYAFAFGDGSTGTVYFLSAPGQLFAVGRNFVLSLVLALLVIIGLTNGLLTYLVSRSIIRPLNALKQVAEDIKEGHLERPVRLQRKDELGQLGDAFEEMRGRLHDSVRLQLQYEEKRKELIASISHDLKTPITGIQACVQALTEGIADTDAKREKYVKMIGIKSAQMNRLIDELFLYSRLDEKKLPFQWERMDMTAFFADWAEELQLDPRLEQIQVSCTLPEGRPPLWVTADREKLGRVLMNIIDNSLKHLDKPEKHIRLALDCDDESVQISIADNGSGIGAEALPHIFDRFYRADPARNAATGGSGLGLAIARQIVEEHGGRIAATSEPGAGTCMRVTLPRHQTERGEGSSGAF